MQKSKKMMVSLCGLALSSLFVLNNKSVVHADTINDANSQNNAISWNSDSDAAQNVQNTQKADDNQQNVQSVQPSRAETSTVESISVQRSTAVQNNAANARTAQDIKVANVDTAQPAVVKQSQANYSETLSNLGTNANLGDLGVYDVSPDGVKSNIQSQVQNQLAIDDASLANFNMNKDASGNLTASFGLYSNTAKQQNWWTDVKVNNTVVPGIQWRTNVNTASDGNLHLASTGQPIVYSVGIHKLPGVVIHNPAGNKVNVHYVNSDGKDIADPVVKDTVVDVSKAGSGSYSVPNGYSLNDPDGKYTVSGGAISGTNLKGNVEHHDAVTKTEHHVGQWNDPNYDEDKKNGTLPYEKDGVLYIYNKYQQKYDPVYEYGNSHVRISYDGDVATDIDKEEYAIGWFNDSRKLITNRNNAMVDYNHYLWLYNPNKGHAENTQMTKQPDYDTTTVVTPAYDTQQLPVAFVDSNNNIVGMVQNYSGKVGTTQNVSLTVPTGYKLADGQTMPTSVTFQNSTSPKLIHVVANGQANSITNPSGDKIHVHFVDQTTGKDVGGDYDINLDNISNGTHYYQTPQGYATDNNGSFTTNRVKRLLVGYGDFQMGVDSGPIIDDLAKALKVSGATDSEKMDNVSKAIDARTQLWVNEGTSLVDEHGNYICSLSSLPGLKDWHDEYAVSEPLVEIRTDTSFDFKETGHVIKNGTVTVPVHEINSFSFADKTDNVKSVRGNTVDVILTKPQSVNPSTDTRCQAQATRTIQINFPDGQVPKSYDGIVDKSGKLVQTVHFTRTATEDALTGNILQYGNWTSDNKDHNFIGFEARTLPRIPGYTLSIKPAQA